MTGEAAVGSITCPICERTSHHPDDVRYGWCGACKTYTRGGLIPSTRSGVAHRSCANDLCNSWVLAGGPSGLCGRCVRLRDTGNPTGRRTARPTSPRGAAGGCAVLLLLCLGAGTAIALIVRGLGAVA